MEVTAFKYLRVLLSGTHRHHAMLHALCFSNTYVTQRAKECQDWKKSPKQWTGKNGSLACSLTQNDSN